VRSDDSTGLAALVVCGTVFTAAGIASADASDDYPIPNRILKTSCTAEQMMAAARHVEPVYYERYMIEHNNKSPEVHQAVQDRIHWFFSMDYAGRRLYSEDTATNAFYEQLAWNWPNWAKPSSTTRPSPPTPPTSAPSTRSTTCPCGTGKRQATPHPRVPRVGRLMGVDQRVLDGDLGS
jgi:hypothetical protein